MEERVVDMGDYSISVLEFPSNIKKVSDGGRVVENFARKYYKSLGWKVMKTYGGRDFSQFLEKLEDKDQRFKNLKKEMEESYHQIMGTPDFFLHKGEPFEEYKFVEVKYYTSGITPQQFLWPKRFKLPVEFVFFVPDKLGERYDEYLELKREYYEQEYVFDEEKLNIPKE